MQKHTEFIMEVLKDDAVSVPNKIVDGFHKEGALTLWPYSGILA